MNEQTIERALSAIGWVVGITLVAVTSVSLIGSTLFLPAAPEFLGPLIGWTLLMLTLLGMILALARRRHVQPLTNSTRER